jgi:CTP:molybdopterin cytidylyltransferase MocA
MTRIGVLLAAGRSERMGRPKQFLTWPPDRLLGKPLVAAAFDAIAPACDAMVVAVGYEAKEVVALLGGRQFRAVAVDSGAEMIASVQAGLRAAHEIDVAAGVLLQPADQPLVHRDTLKALISAAAEQPKRAVLPEYQGRGGHPVLIPAPLIPEIVSFNGPGGLRQFWIDNPDFCLRLAVGDAGVVFDLDTPVDYGSVVD